MLDRLSDLAYRTLYPPVGAAAVLLWGFRVTGSHHIPRSGPVLLIGNHQSFLDIPIMGLANPRRTHFLARRTLYHNRILGSLMSYFGTIPVDIDGFSRSGLEGILRELNKGHCVLIYPEGERTWNGKMGTLKPGVSLVVRKAKCPIVPVGIAGAYDAWPRTKAWPRFAPPFLSWSPARLAVSIGPPLDGVALAAMERQPMLQTLHKALSNVVAQAEHLQRGNRR